MSHSSIDEAHQSNFRRKIATHRLENAVIADNVIVDIASRSYKSPPWFASANVQYGKLIERRC